MLRKQSQVLVEGNATSEIIEVDVMAGVSLGWMFLWGKREVISEKNGDFMGVDVFFISFIYSLETHIKSPLKMMVSNAGISKLPGGLYFQGILLVSPGKVR